MANPIKETPVLSGRDSRRFMKKITENEKKKVPKKDYNRAMKVYREMTKTSDI